jgi:hypothetical protein
MNIQLNLDLPSALTLVANLQLALRHPGNVGGNTDIMRQLVAGVVQRFEQAGLTAHVELALLGDGLAPRPRFIC